MKSSVISGVRFYPDPAEQEASGSIATALERSVPQLQQHWGLSTPENLHVYVMTSWRQFLIQSAPWPWKAYVVLALPLLARRARAIWPFSGGWSLNYGQNRVVGVKPHRLIQSADRTLGEQIFLPNRTMDEIVQSVTCHELTHAFTAHLHLPAWLNEGLATLAMEVYLDRRIVRPETIELLPVVKGSERLQTADMQALLALYARGYWAARYLDECQPEFLHEILSQRLRSGQLEDRLAAEFGTQPERLWEQLTGAIKARYA